MAHVSRNPKRCSVFANAQFDDSATISPVTRTGCDPTVNGLQSSFINAASAGTLGVPVSACHNQDSEFGAAFAVLRKAIVEHAFPAATVALVQRRTIIALKAFGRFTSELDSREVRESTIFD